MNRKPAVLFILLLLGSALASGSQTEEDDFPLHDLPVSDVPVVRPTDRITAAIDENQRVVLFGQHHPAATAEYATGDVPPDQRMEKMVLVLQANPAQEWALEELLQAQQDPESGSYHQWLTPQEFGRSFGTSINDMEKIVIWLQSHGMEIEEIPASKRALVFSGTVEQVESTFHTAMRTYSVNGESHFANATDPEIPQALAEVVSGIVSLHDFVSAPMHVLAPAFTSGGAHYLMPQDWDTIYDVGLLYNQGITGAGQSIAVLGRVDVALADVSAFRSYAGLPANAPQIIVNGADPGSPDLDDEIESALDVEWAGAIARSATVKFVTSKSGASDGITLSAQYAVGHNVAPIISLSYGSCEAAEGSGGNAFWNSLWQQAAAQGISVFVASGDSGAAGCDSSSATRATQGLAVNGLCSSPYSTCVGGTQFNDASNPSEYWAATNGSGMASALSYIPELVWNQSVSSGLWASGGGASTVYSKPAWQSAPGVPADGKRDVPDVALAASGHDAYVVQIKGSAIAVGGTSAATPSMASVMALVAQHAAAAQGDVNPVLYALARLQLSSDGAAAFHDITSGNNGVPGLAGFNAGTGYDQASGLGSVDASLLVNHWSDGTANFALASSSSSVTVARGSSSIVTLTATDAGGFNSPVTLTASGMPTGVTVRFSSATVTSAASVIATISVATNAVAGNSTLTIAGNGGGLKRTVPLALTVLTPTFTLVLSASKATVKTGSRVPITVSTSTQNGFASAITLSVSGLPKGVTATFAPGSIASPGVGSSTLTVAAASNAAAATANQTVTAAGGGITKTQALSLTVMH